MERRILGKDLAVSPVGLGCMRIYFRHWKSWELDLWLFHQWQTAFYLVNMVRTQNFKKVRTTAVLCPNLNQKQ